MLHLETVDASTLVLIKKLQPLPILKEFSLVGGTALALKFGHRTSIDIDLFQPGEEFQSQIIYQSIQENFNGTKLGNLYTFGVFLTIEDVKTDLIKHPFPLLKNPDEEDGIRMFSLDDIGAMKIAAIAQRGEKKDFVDLFYLCKNFKPLLSIFQDFKKKYSLIETYHIIRSLQYFDEAEVSKMPFMLDKSINWPTIKTFFTKEVNALTKGNKF